MTALGPSTPYPNTDKTVETIQAEAHQLFAGLMAMVPSPDDPSHAQCRMMAVGLTAIFERLGDFWVWNKAHRGP